MAKYLKKVPESIVKSYVGKQPQWGPIGYVTYKRTYARRIDEHTTEEWWNTTERCLNGLLEIGGAFTREEIEELFDLWFNLKVTTGGRGLWQLGTDNIHRIGGDSLQNCHLVQVDGSRGPTKPFEYAFNQLMLGGGVGGVITKETVFELPSITGGRIERVRGWDCDFIITDNREGWVKLLRKVMEVLFFGGSITYSTDAIRPKGTPIKGFGGVASGPDILVQGINDISRIFNRRRGSKLQPIDVLDIWNIIGYVVKSGNVRRSAEIMIGDIDDLDFINAKNWAEYQVPNWRTVSNNTAQADFYEQLNEPFWNTYRGGSEAYGLFNRRNAREFGRLIDGRGDHDPLVVGLNPCGEITMESYEACNLADIDLPLLSGPKEFYRCAYYAAKITKTISAHPFSDPVANAVKQRNHRLGIGVTGVRQNNKRLNRPFIEKEFDQAYQVIREADREYSKLLGINESIKVTTVKPSGTRSSLTGSNPGVHKAEAPYFIRRVRYASDDPLVQVCKDHGYHVEPALQMDGTHDLSTAVVEFPVAAPEGSAFYEPGDVIDQLESQLKMQTYWSDNAVSITCRYRPEELPQIKEWLAENYDEKVKTVSFMLYEGHGFVQAPFEPVTKEKYQHLASRVRPIQPFEDYGDEDRVSSVGECEGGACPTR